MVKTSGFKNISKYNLCKNIVKMDNWLKNISFQFLSKHTLTHIIFGYHILFDVKTFSYVSKFQRLTINCFLKQCWVLAWSLSLFAQNDCKMCQVIFLSLHSRNMHIISHTASVILKSDFDIVDSLNILTLIIHVNANGVVFSNSFMIYCFDELL